MSNFLYSSVGFVIIVIVIVLVVVIVIVVLVAVVVVLLIEHIGNYRLITLEYFIQRSERDTH